MRHIPYSMPISDQKFGLNQTAASRAHHVPKDDLFTHDLDKLADRLCPAPHLEIAKLHADRKTGTRKDRNIVVSIPFSGDAKTFELKPSRFSRPSAQFDIEDECINVVFADDDSLEQQLNSFVEVIGRNIESVRSEWMGINGDAKVDVRHILEARRKQVEAEKARDAKRSFPID